MKKVMNFHSVTGLIGFCVNLRLNELRGNKTDPVMSSLQRSNSEETQNLGDAISSCQLSDIQRNLLIL